MVDQTLRHGNFNSSEIVALLSMGKRYLTKEELAARPKTGKGSAITQANDPKVLGEAALTFIEKKNWERRLGRSLDNETTARPLSWGNLCEGYVFDSIDLSYKLISQETLVHPEYDYWVGTPDATRSDSDTTVADIKCPLTLESFCKLVSPLYLDVPLSGIEAMNYIREKHPDGEKFYWQLVSNGCLTGAKYAELIIFVPYQDELEAIRDLAAQTDQDAYKYFWINNAQDSELPSLIRGGFYKSLNVIAFEIPQEDKELLKNRVILGGTKLVKR